jgi:hypothetical protein
MFSRIFPHRTLNHAEPLHGKKISQIMIAHAVGENRTPVLFLMPWRCTSATGHHGRDGFISLPRACIDVRVYCNKKSTVRLSSGGRVQICLPEGIAAAEIRR